MKKFKKIMNKFNFQNKKILKFKKIMVINLIYIYIYVFYYKKQQQ